MVGGKVLRSRIVYVSLIPLPLTFSDRDMVLMTLLNITPTFVELLFSLTLVIYLFFPP